MPKSRSSKIAILLMALVLLAGVAIGSWSYAKRQKRLLYERAKESLRNDVKGSLPVGSEKAVVLQFLKQHSILYYDFDPKSAFGEGTIINDPWYAGASQSVKGGTGWIGICRIEVEFKFNENEKLLGYRDQPTCKESLF